MMMHRRAVWAVRTLAVCAVLALWPAAAQAAEPVRLLVELPPDTPNKWDLADPLPDGWTIGAMAPLIDTAKPVANDTDARAAGGHFVSFMMPASALMADAV